MRQLSTEGHVAQGAGNADQARGLALAGGFDVMVLDAEISGTGRRSLVPRLTLEVNLPIVVLCGDGRPEERVRLLQLGADDVLARPFAYAELSARLMALGRRQPRRSDGHDDGYRLADLELDPVRRRVRRAGRVLELSAREFTLLAVLLRHQGEVMSRTALLEAAWPSDRHGDSNVVEVAIRRLRSKLDDPFRTKLLHTVRGMGYVLESKLEKR